MLTNRCKVKSVRYVTFILVIASLAKYCLRIHWNRECDISMDMKLFLAIHEGLWKAKEDSGLNFQLDVVVAIRSCFKKVRALRIGEETESCWLVEKMEKLKGIFVDRNNNDKVIMKFSKKGNTIYIYSKILMKEQEDSERSPRRLRLHPGSCANGVTVAIFAIFPLIMFAIILGMGKKWVIVAIKTTTVKNSYKTTRTLRRRDNTFAKQLASIRA